LRHQVAVILSELTVERASQRKNAAVLLVYLFWAFSGVTLARKRMVATISLASSCVSNFESDALSHLVAGFRALS
jgi:hypothetical protein